MKPRSSTLAGAALLLVAGCSGPPSGPVPAPRATGGNEVVFAPVGSAPARKPGADDLPPVPVPEGWVPAREQDSAEVLGLEAVESAASPGMPLFAEEPEDGEFEAEPAVFDEVVLDEVAYYEYVDIETETIEIGTPVLVIQGYSSWGYGTFPAVPSSRGFDPCFSPPAGACWEPVDFDPCWNPCGDPGWGSWETWNRACDERDRRGPVPGSGPDVVPDVVRPGQARVARQKPPAPDPEPVGHPIPSSPPPPPEPAEPTFRAPPVARVHEPVVDTGDEASAPAPRRDPRARRTVPQAAPAPEPVSEPLLDPEPRVEVVRRLRPAREPDVERPAEEASSRPERPRRQERQERAETPREEPAPEPAQRHAREQKREEPRPEPAREPERERRGNGREREPEAAPPAPPPPPPTPPPERERRQGGGKRGR